MKTIALILLTPVVGLVGLWLLPHVFGAVFGLLVGGLALALGAVVSLLASGLGLVLGGIGAAVGIGVGAMPLLIPPAIVAVPIVLLIVCIRALSANSSR